MEPLSEKARFRVIKAVVCAVLLVCVVVIVIAPEVDLPPTVLRAAQRLILPLLIQLAALVLVLMVPVRADHFAPGLPLRREASLPPLLSRSSTICVLLC